MENIDWSNNLPLLKSYRYVSCFLCEKKVNRWNMVWHTDLRHRVNVCDGCFEVNKQ